MRTHRSADDLFGRIANFNALRVAAAKAMRRRRFMFAVSSIGPGASNMVTAAAVAVGIAAPGAAARHRTSRR